MAKKIRVWDGTAWQDVAPSLPYTAIHSAQASMPATGVDGQVWLDTDGTLADTAFVPLTGGTMTGNLNVSSINSGGIAGKNFIINGGMDFWQRGTSFTTDSGGNWSQYTADRWIAYAYYPGYSATQTITQESNLSNVPTGSKYSLKAVLATSNASINPGRMAINYTLENQDSLLLAGKTVTLSFQIKGIANIDRIQTVVGYNPSGGKVSAPMGETQIINQNRSITSSGFTLVSYTFTAPSASTLTTTGTIGFTLYYQKSNGTPEQVGDGIYLGNVQLEVGGQATTFNRSGSTLQAELAACQRYYYRMNADTIYTVFGLGPAESSAFIIFSVPIPVQMRVNPTSLDTSNVRAYSTSGWILPSALSLNSGESSKHYPSITADVTGATADKLYRLMAFGTTSAYVGFSAEL
jgi:hypothetical protein